MHLKLDGKRNQSFSKNQFSCYFSVFLNKYQHILLWFIQPTLYQFQSFAMIKRSITSIRHILRQNNKQDNSMASAKRLISFPLLLLVALIEKKRCQTNSPTKHHRGFILSGYKRRQARSQIVTE